MTQEPGGSEPVKPPIPGGQQSRAVQPGLAESSYLLSLVNENKVFSLLLYGAFVLLKVLAVSHWNIATASAILAASSATDLILGALLSALPMGLLGVFSFVLFGWLSGHWARRYSPRDRSAQGMVRGWVVARLPILLTLGFLLPAVIYLPPAAPVLVCVVAAVLLGAVARSIDPLRKAAAPRLPAGQSHVSGDDLHFLSGRDTFVHNWHVLRRHLPTFYCGVALSAVVVLIGYSQLVSSVWLPHERVTCQGCQHPVIGYVLNSNSTDLTILLSGSRVISIIPAADVIERRVCTIPYSWPLLGQTSEPLTVAQRIGLRDDVPSCTEGD